MFFADISAWTLRNIVIRLVTAMALGGLIGIDRGAKRRGGGARTDSAVCIGAALVMMTGQYIEIRWPGLADISRMASQVVSGVGFLGAGSILVSGHQVKGLTSAAGIWLSACIGLAVGIGFVDGAVLATLVLLAGLHLLPLLEEKIYQYSRYVILYVEADEGGASAEFLHHLKMDGCKVDRFDVDKSGGMQSFTILTTIRLPKDLNRDEYIEELSRMRGIHSIDIM
ncbi:MAG: MgtC/SapB family protein [Lachnospiraceae bacterium]|jgi:putative Mg2+ transporter-C (MgtC) family protein|nr:MgtC/SapB family protein [Lachnospiraceae bacterium]